MSRVLKVYDKDNYDLLLNDKSSVLNNQLTYHPTFFSLQLVKNVGQSNVGHLETSWDCSIHRSPIFIAGISDMTRKSLALIRCIISGEDEDEDPQKQQQQLKSVKQVYDMIT